MAAGDRIVTGPIRVLIAGMPRLLAAVVRRTLSEERDMEIVAHVCTPAEFRAALQQPIDVVVTTPAADGPSPDVRALLFAPNPVPVVAISADGKRLDVYGHAAIHGTGLDGLTALIREAVTRARPRTGGQ